MGGQNSKQEEHLTGHLTSDEVTTLKKLFNSFHTQVSTVEKEKCLCASYQDFQRHCEIYFHDWLAQRIADKLSIHSSRQEALIPFNRFLVIVSDLVKGSLEEKVNVIWNLAIPSSPKPRDTITALELIQYTRCIIESYLKCMEQTDTYRSWKDAEICYQLTPDSINDLAEYLLTDILYGGVPSKDIVNQSAFTKDSFSREEVEKCFSSSALLQQIHSSVAASCFGLDLDTNFVRLMPNCMKAQCAFLPEQYSLLDHARIIFLNSHLPLELRTTWRFLFSTAAHGESFAKMVGQLGEKGPTLIIIKDNGGRIFGAFATDNWKFGPKFCGNRNSFLFHLSPKFAQYPSTGYNDNFQYFNAQQQTFPNGMGIGGKLEYFAIWLDAEFGKGKSSPTCTTYDSPQMATSEEFSIHHLEVWGAGPEPKKDEDERAGTSILDKNPDAKVLLELTGKSRQSDGYRDEPHCNE